MSRFGEKILAGAREAVAIVSGDFNAIRRAKVHPSSGCVFCDLGIPVTKMKRQKVHYNRRHGIEVCTNRDNI